MPSDCDVDDDDVDDDPIWPVKEKSHDIADFNTFNQDQEYIPFRIWKNQLQKKWQKNGWKIVLLEGGAPNGYCQENLWILSWGG